MPERYFVQRPQANTYLEWTGSNLEEIRDFWQARGYDRYAFDVDADGNLTNPSGNPLPPGTLTAMAGGFGYTTEAELLAQTQEVANPEGLKYTVIEQPLP